MTSDSVRQGRAVEVVGSPAELDGLEALLPETMIADRPGFRRRLAGLRRRIDQGKPADRGTARLQRDVNRSVQRCRRRRERLPTPTYPEELPVSERRDDIAAAVAGHQVVVVAGETGSGKTTQLPKICLELGRGVAGLIGHTQPRRIAARTVAQRIAAELEGEVGHAVGYKVRFTDRVGPDGYIKLMTDGILLAETRGDPLLEQYDTLIIDEAHERSLNIDFLLGYLKRLLPRRPDLKVIITSATIDTERFARHFDAPVIEVSGRTYPVEVKYRPLVVEDEDERDRSLQEGIAEAVDEAGRLDPRGDVLVFLPGERDIRETAETLRQRGLKHTEILPLFSRLSVAEQNRVFQSHPGRRIVLATNVAETSLTVPGIRFVIDSGLARISRYSHRTKVQRLPIEPVAQASANQRAGRCGRIGPGVCFRLYSEDDYHGRPEFTEPEIRRTNLASVILQMKHLGLGAIEEFPFLDPPDRRFINDGYRVLHELGAVDARREITATGRELARLPVDPRIGRMVLAARREGALEEVLVIASALSVQDPRERPMDAQQKADEAQKEFKDESSDFLSLLHLWEAYHERARHLSQRKLRRWCHERFISYLRMREWHDIHGQLAALAKSGGVRGNTEPAGYTAVHRSLLAGLLGQIAVKTDEPETKKGRKRPPIDRYTGARNVKLAIFPGSVLAKQNPQWIMAAELVETSRLFARTVASIQPQWVEELGTHLLKRSYSEPHWQKRRAQVAAFEQVTLYGLVVVERRRVNYGPIDPETSRQIFIRRALVEGDYRSDAPFFVHNRRLLDEVEAMEAKSRRRDLLVDEEVLYDFYDSRIPEGIYSGPAFEKWRRKAEREDPQRLFLTRELLMRHDANAVTGERFPDTVNVGGIELQLRYRFEPGDPADGVTAVVPLAALNQLSPERFQWLVPGLIEEKVTALIRSLSKSLRRNFVPAPDFAAAAVRAMKPEEGDLTVALCRQLLRMTGVQVPDDAFDEAVLPEHLRMNFRVVDAQGQVVDEGRDLSALQCKLGGKAAASVRTAPSHGLEREGLTRWEMEEVPERINIEQHGVRLTGYPALTNEGDSVALRVFDRPDEARRAMAEGLCRLFALEERQVVRYVAKNLPHLDRMCLYYAPLGSCSQLRDDIVGAAIRRVVLSGDEMPRDREAWRARREAARRELPDAVNAVAETVRRVLEAFHEVRKALKGSVSPAWLEAFKDMGGQLEHLVYPGFVSATPTQWLDHLPRFVRAIALRQEKLRRDPERDRRGTLEVRPFWEDYLARADSGRRNDELILFRWMIEEFRVSLFAQELGTSMPVSAKRLKAQQKVVDG